MQMVQPQPQSIHSPAFNTCAGGLCNIAEFSLRFTCIRWVLYEIPIFIPEISPRKGNALYVHFISQIEIKLSVFHKDFY